MPMSFHVFISTTQSIAAQTDRKQKSPTPPRVTNRRAPTWTVGGLDGRLRLPPLLLSPEGLAPVPTLETDPQLVEEARPLAARLLVQPLVGARVEADALRDGPRRRRRLQQAPPARAGLPVGVVGAEHRQLAGALRGGEGDVEAAAGAVQPAFVLPGGGVGVLVAAAARARVGRVEAAVAEQDLVGAVVVLLGVARRLDGGLGAQAAGAGPVVPWVAGAVGGEDRRGRGAVTVARGFRVVIFSGYDSMFHVVACNFQFPVEMCNFKFQFEICSSNSKFQVPFWNFKFEREILGFILILGVPLWYCLI